MVNCGDDYRQTVVGYSGTMREMEHRCIAAVNEGSVFKLYFFGIVPGRPLVLLPLHLLPLVCTCWCILYFHFVFLPIDIYQPLFTRSVDHSSPNKCQSVSRLEMTRYCEAAKNFQDFGAA